MHFIVFYGTGCTNRAHQYLQNKLCVFFIIFFTSNRNLIKSMFVRLHLLGAPLTLGKGTQEVPPPVKILLLGNLLYYSFAFECHLSSNCVVKRQNPRGGQCSRPRGLYQKHTKILSCTHLFLCAFAVLPCYGCWLPSRAGNYSATSWYPHSTSVSSCICVELCR